MVSLKVRTAFGYQAAVFGFSFRDLERSCVQRVTMAGRAGLGWCTYDPQIGVSLYRTAQSRSRSCQESGQTPRLRRSTAFLQRPGAISYRAPESPPRSLPSLQPLPKFQPSHAAPQTKRVRCYDDFGKFTGEDSKDVGPGYELLPGGTAMTVSLCAPRP
jgi:hypothetical protein